jgi:ATP-dependent helicase/nuclease subunit B
VPPGAPFLDGLARAVLDGALTGTRPPPEQLPSHRIYLPTRRSVRALQDAFLCQARSKALLLPRIEAIGEGDEEASLLLGGACEGPLPPAIGKLERQLVLTRLVLAWGRAMRLAHLEDGIPDASLAAANPAQCAALARGLASLMDMVETEGADVTRLAELVPEGFSGHWQRTLDFLNIVTEHFPAILEEHGLASPAARRNLALAQEAKLLTTHPPEGLVIVAGVTGSVPATVALMRAIAGLPNGLIVLPGLDQDLDEEAWAEVRERSPSHPQHRLARLLAALGITRDGVDILPGIELSSDHAGTGRAHSPTTSLPPVMGKARGLGLGSEASKSLGARDGGEDAGSESAADPRPQPSFSRRTEEEPVLDRRAPLEATGRATRARLLSEVMRPAALTGDWADLPKRLDREAVREALKGVTLIEAGSAEEEAEAVALVMRRAAEDTATTAALVTPDRVLARRVAIRLQAWGIRVDDSAGRPLPKTVPGAFLDLVLAALAGNFRPAPLMALLKHPLTRLGLPVADVRRRARHLELLAFRRSYLGEGLEAVRSAVQDAGTGEAGLTLPARAAARLDTADRAKAIALIDRVAEAFTPLLALAGSARSLPALAAAHVAAAEALAADETGAASALWAEEAGEAASVLLASLQDPSAEGPEIALTDYPELYRTLAQGETVRPRAPVHPRLFIWGPLEARLQQPDTVILGGLNDGTWPERAEPDPWLNRPMLEALALPPPEARIGDAAHDFTMLLGAGRVIMSRAAKIDGVPTVPSRWLMRLEAVLGGLGLADVLHPGEDEPWLDWARERDRIGARRPVTPPSPRPAVANRPRRMSVTRIERWVANPYEIFARDILGLEPLPPLSGEPDERLRGIVIHEVLKAFGRAYPDRLPDDIAGALMRLAVDVFATLQPHPRVTALWRPRFERFAKWFAETEPRRRQGVGRVMTEVAGAHVIGAPAGPFRLTARADRIDVAGDGRLVITDYKSGTVPKQKDVEAGWSPQLPLEAAIALAGGFEGMHAAGIAGLRYIQASGGDPPGDEVDIRTDDAAALARKALAGVGRLVADFDRPETAYRAIRRARLDSRYRIDPYAHLARLKEWLGEGDGDD